MAMKRRSDWAWPNGYGYTEALKGLSEGASVVINAPDSGGIRALAHRLWGAGNYAIRAVGVGAYRVTRLNSGKSVL